MATNFWKNICCEFYLSASTFLRTEFELTRQRPVASQACSWLAALTLGTFTYTGVQAESAQTMASAPSGPVTIVVPYAAGGLTDNLGRAMAKRLSERWGKPVVVENRPGGGTTIGTAAVARAAGDGHTLLLTSFGYTTNPFMMRQLPYRQDALEPLAMVAIGHSIVYVHPSVPANNIAELVQYIKASRKPFSFASSGNGSSPHIGAELFASQAGIQIVHVPYKGNGPAINDLVGGQVNALIDSKATLAFVKAGKLKALGTTAPKPAAWAPNLQPIAASGIPGLANFSSGSWFGFLVPASTPRPLQNRLYADIRAVLDTEDMRSAIDRAGVEPLMFTQAEFSNYLKNEATKWGALIRAKNITAE